MVELKFTLKTIIVAAVFIGVIFVVMGATSVGVWEYTNSDQFCATACHDVHPQEPMAHAISMHAKVDCVECHLGRVGTFEAMVRKVGHTGHAWSYLFGYERPVTAVSMEGAEDTCDGCHTNTPHQYNQVHARKYYEDNKRNTERAVIMTMRLAGRHFGGETRRGMNWHSSGNVRYVPGNELETDIPWVEATMPDGSRVVYEDVRNPLDARDLSESDAKTMDCVSCHNRAGHPFPNPERRIDRAIAAGAIDPALPYVKARLMELLEQDFSSEEEARQLVSDAWQSYREEFPELAEEEPEAWAKAERFAEQNQEAMTQLMLRSTFRGDDLTWRSFPDHNGHKDSPGCFRCHNGRLQTTEGEPIPVNCTTCHSIPLVTKNESIPDFFLAIADKKKPDYHNDPAFMARHSELADLREEECEECHQRIRFGSNDRTYCANSGCHGENWEYLDYEAIRMTAEPEPDADSGESIEEPAP